MRHISRTLTTFTIIAEIPIDVVVIRFDFSREIVSGGEVKDCAGRRNVLLDHHDAPGAMEHSQGKAALSSRDLVVIKLHRVDGAAAELVVLRVRAEDRTQQNAGLSSLWMLFNRAGGAGFRGKDVHFYLIIHFPPHAVDLIVALRKIDGSGQSEITQKDYKSRELRPRNM